MTVQELIDNLQKLKDKDQPVILSRDGEGNGFNMVAQLEELRFVPERYGRADVYNPDEAPECAKPCIVMWPV